MRIPPVLCALCAVLAAAPRPLRAQHGDTLVVGTYAYVGIDREAAVRPLAMHLGKQLRRPVRIVVANDPIDLFEMVPKRGIDVVVTNTFGYLLLTIRPNDPAVHAVAGYRIPQGERTNYATVILARDTTLRADTSLAGRAGQLEFMLVSPGSTTGNLIPRLYLGALGLRILEKSVLTVRYAGSHALALQRLREGAADVAALASEEFDRQRAADTTGAVAGLKVLWRSPDIPLGPLAVRATLPRRLRDSVAAVIVGLERTDPAAFAALKGGWTEAKLADALVPVDDRAYDDVRRLFGDPRMTALMILQYAR